MKDHDLKNEKLPLGFTFSFPCKQEGLAKARLSKWTKGFRCEGVVGEDITYLLHEALKRKNVSAVKSAEPRDAKTMTLGMWRLYIAYVSCKQHLEIFSEI